MKAIRRHDIRSETDEVKYKIYEEIHRRWNSGIKVSMNAHRSGFPAITIDCEEIAIITDVLSLERWWALRKEEGDHDNEA